MRKASRLPALLAGLACTTVQAISTTTVTARGRELLASGRVVGYVGRPYSPDAVAEDLNRAIEQGLPLAQAPLSVGTVRRPVTGHDFGLTDAGVGSRLAVPVAVAVVPLDATITLPVAGWPVDAGFRLAGIEPPLLDAMPDAGYSSLSLTGRLPGRAVLMLARGDLRLAVPVEVRAPAARPLPLLTADVAGPVSERQLQEHLQGLVEAAAQRGPRTRLTVGPWSTASGYNHGALPIVLDADEQEPLRQQVPVGLTRHLSRPAQAAQVVTVAEPQARLPRLLARASLGARQAGRAAWAVRNATAAALGFEVRLCNRGETAAQAWVDLSAAGPSADVAWCRFRALRDFLVQRHTGAGVCVQVPPHASWALTARDVPPAQVVFGWCEVEAEASELELQVATLTAGGARFGPRPLLDSAAEATPWQADAPPAGDSAAVVTAHAWRAPLSDLPAGTWQHFRLALPNRGQGGHDVALTAEPAAPLAVMVNGAPVESDPRAGLGRTALPCPGWAAGQSGSLALDVLVPPGLADPAWLVLSFRDGSPAVAPTGWLKR